MTPLEILEQWVEPLTGPLGDFLKETQVLATTHQNSVANFENLVADLTDAQAPDAFVGDAATSMVELAQEYLASEYALSGTVGTLAGPLAEGGAACATAVATIGEGVTTAASEAVEAEPLIQVTAVVDVAAAAQGELDPVNDVAEVGLTAITAIWIIGILVLLGAALFGAWWLWQNSMNDIASKPRPKLPRTPTAPVPPQAFHLTPQQEEMAKRLHADFGRTGLSLDDIREIIAENPNLTEAQLRALLAQYAKVVAANPNLVKQHGALAVFLLFIAVASYDAAKNGKYSTDPQQRVPVKGSLATGIEEAEAVLGALESGQLTWPVRPSGHPGSEVVDSKGQEWDVKAWRSPLPSDITKLLEKVRLRDIAPGEKIILDDRWLSDDDIKRLYQEIQKKGLGNKFIWWPKQPTP